jgi:hypothetical protein
MKTKTSTITLLEIEINYVPLEPELSMRTISKQGAMIWNLLKTNIDTHTSFTVFKRNTKSYLLSAY